MPPAAETTPRVRLVGLHPDGWTEVPERLRALLLAADVLLGDPAVLVRIPRAGASFAQAREPWPDPSGGAVGGAVGDLLWRHRGYAVVGVVAGDPLRTPMGRELAALLGPGLQVEPGVSSVAMVAAGLGWTAGEHDVVDLHGRGIGALARELAPGRRLLVLLDGASGASGVDGRSEIESVLRDHGYGASRVTSWEAAPDVVAMELDGPVVSPWSAGLPDAMLSGRSEPGAPVLARDLRASALARLAPQPGQLLWDLGSAGGGVAIEWLRAHRRCRALALTPDVPDEVGAAARRLGVGHLEVLPGRADDAIEQLAGRDAPDAVYVADPLARTALLDLGLRVVRPGGRLVVQTSTPDGAALLGVLYAARGGELTRIAIDVATHPGADTVWTSRDAVTQWAWQRPSAT